MERKTHSLKEQIINLFAIKPVTLLKRKTAVTPVITAFEHLRGSDVFPDIKNNIC